MSSRVDVPERFVHAIRSNLGNSADNWLEKLPEILAECVENWSLTPDEPFAELSFNYVAPVTRSDGSSAVLKVGQPADKELMSEIDALRLYDGRSIVRLLDEDRSRGAMLLERLRPGEMLSTLEDDEVQTEIAASVMQHLWRPAPEGHSFPTVADWGRGFERFRRMYDGGSGPLPANLADRAEALYADLVASQGPQVLLHGDLHHFNILSATREPWLAIDPKGVVGEAEYETGALLRNPMPGILDQPNPGKVLERRIAQLSEYLGFDCQRVLDWAIAQSVLSAWWGIDDSDRLDPFWIEMATVTATIRV